MKLLFLSISLVVFTFNSFSQTLKKSVYPNGYPDGNYVFETTFETAAGEKKTMEFSISSDVLTAIQNSDIFKNSGSDDIESFLDIQTNLASHKAKNSIRHPNSYIPTNDVDRFNRPSILFAYNKLIISFPFNAKNDYGHPVTGKATYIVEIVYGEEKTTNFIGPKD